MAELTQKEEEVRKKREEEERKVKVVEEEARMKRETEEREAKEWVDLVNRLKEMAEWDPAFLVESGLQVSSPYTTYLAVDGSKCKKCRTCNAVCIGVTKKTCTEGVRLHDSCSNNNSMKNHISFILILLNVLPGHKGSLGEPDTANVGCAKPGKHPRPRHTRQSPARSTTFSSTFKWKVIKFDEDNDLESNVTRKRAKVSNDKDLLLSRAEVVELVRTVVMELQSIQNALNGTQEALANFTSQASGK